MKLSKKISCDISFILNREIDNFTSIIPEEDNPISSGRSVSISIKLFNNDKN
jgi:hypothetical protein